MTDKTGMSKETRVRSLGVSISLELNGQGFCFICVEFVFDSGYLEETGIVLEPVWIFFNKRVLQQCVEVCDPGPYAKANTEVFY